ncbi:MAG: Flp pilus assembly protein CpaB [Maricaulaceae bacterium]|jgi:pilus assembly protein CpaB
MSVARLLVLIGAGAAAVFVWLYVRNSSADIPEPQQIVAAPAPSALRVLVAARPLPLGTRITPGDLVWRDWPDGGVAPEYITDGDDAQAIENHAGAIVRDALSAGEPVLPSKLVTVGESGFMAAILDPGKRAVSTRINAEIGAGGFILPGDRVDAILTWEQENDATGDRFTTSRTVLENVRVLAIDQSPQRADDDQVKVGSTATLELSPNEVQVLAMAQAMGDITLALRSVADSNPDAAWTGSDGSDARNAFGGGISDTLTVYRYGAPSRTSVRGMQ